MRNEPHLTIFLTSNSKESGAFSYTKWFGIYCVRILVLGDSTCWRLQVSASNPRDMGTWHAPHGRRDHKCDLALIPFISRILVTVRPQPSRCMPCLVAMWPTWNGSMSEMRMMNTRRTSNGGARLLPSHQLDRYSCWPYRVW